MKFRKIALSILLGAAFSFTSFANTFTDGGDEPTTVSTAIKEMIQDVKIDLKKFDNKTVIIKFMVNDNNEILVLDTNNSKLDEPLKSGLNYKKISTKNVKHNFIYVLPVKFKA